MLLRGSERGGPPRVLFVGHTARLSGGEIALLRLLPGLQQDVDPLVVLAEDGPLVERLRQRGVEVVVLPLGEGTRELRRDRAARAGAVARQLLPLLSYVWALRGLIRSRGIDVVHTNTLKAGFYGTLAARLAGVPSVWHVRDRIAEDYLPRAAVRTVRLALALLPHRILTNSHATGRTVTAGAGGRRRRTRLAAPLYDPLDAPAAVPPRPREGVFTVGVVGRLAPWKGQHLVVEALAGLPPDCRLLVVGSALFGEDDYVRELHEQVRDRGLADRVHFRGFVDDVFEVLPELDVLVHASTVPEPFGQVVVEALSAGVPVVAVGDGGPGEILTHGTDGLLYGSGDVAALTALLLELRADPALRARLRANGLRRAADFTCASVCPPLVDLYRELARPRRPVSARSGG